MDDPFDESADAMLAAPVHGEVATAVAAHMQALWRYRRRIRRSRLGHYAAAHGARFRPLHHQDGQLHGYHPCAHPLLAIPGRAAGGGSVNESNDGGAVGGLQQLDGWREDGSGSGASPHYYRRESGGEENAAAATVT